MATAFIKGKVNDRTEKWEDAVTDEDLRKPLEEVDAEVRKNDPVRSKWSVKRPLDAQYYCAMWIAQYFDGSP